MESISYADIICGKIRGWMPDPDGESTHHTISSDSNGSPHSRESDLEMCKNSLKDLENGHSTYLGEKGQRWGHAFTAKCWRQADSRLSRAAMWWM